MSCKSDCWDCNSDSGLVTWPVNSSCKLRELKEDSLWGESGCITGWSCPKVWLLWLRSIDDRLLDLGCSCKFTPQPWTVSWKTKENTWIYITHHITSWPYIHQSWMNSVTTHLQIPWLKENSEHKMRMQKHEICPGWRKWITPKLL